MHLHDHPRALAELLAEALAVDLLAPAGGPGAEPRCVVDLGAAAAQAGVAEAGPSLARRLGVLLLGLGDQVRRDAEQDHVVHDVGVSRQHVEAGDHLVAGQLRVQQEAAVVVGADPGRRRRRVGLRHPHGRRGAPPAAAACAAPARPAAGVPVVVRRGRRCGVARPALRCRSRRGASSWSRRGAAGGRGTRRQGRGDEAPRGRRTPARAHPGGQVMARPPSTCMWAWKTVWWACAPVLNTSR